MPRHGGTYFRSRLLGYTLAKRKKGVSAWPVGHPKESQHGPLVVRIKFQLRRINSIIARCSTMGLPLRLSLSRFAASSVTCLGPHNSRPSIRKRAKKKGLCFSDLPAFTSTEPDLWPSLPRGVPRVAGDRGVPATFGDVELPWRCLFLRPIASVELSWRLPDFKR